MHFILSRRIAGFKTVLLAGIMAGFLSAAFAQTYTGEPNNRVTVNLGDTPWKFKKGDFISGTPSGRDAGYNDASWDPVAIPHCVNAADSWLNFETGLHATTHKDFFWYRKRFTLDAAYTGRRIELEFQGVNIACAVYVNGTFKPNIHKVTQPGDVTHVNGHLPFVVDITNDVKFGAENVIAVRVSNNPDGAGFFKPADIGDFIGFGMGFGGIHRPVYVHITDKVHVPLNVYSNIRRWGTYVGTTAATIGSATVRMQTNVYNDDSQSKSIVVVTKVVDAKNNVVSTQTSLAQNINAGSSLLFDQTATIENPTLWYPNNNANGKPYLYKVYHIVQSGGKTLDVLKSPLGIRVITWDKNFAYINGQKHLFWGFGSRYEYPGFGSAVPEEQQWRDVKLMAECGGSMLRPGHVPIATATVEACDAYGVCLFENTMDNEWSLKGEIPLAYKDEFHRDCIIRDRNHPSLAVWELNNGCWKQVSGQSGKVFTHPAGWIKRMIDSIKVYDHFAPRAAATRDSTDYWPPAPSESAPCQLIIGNVWGYFRKWNTLPTWGAESWFISNARFSYNHEVKHTDEFINETVQCINTNGLGYAHWMFMECGGESYANFLDASIGKTQRKTLGASAVDHNRIPKLIYNAYKNAVWIPYSIRPGVALQSHWNYSAGKQTVTAYSNCPSVELLLNGQSIGVQTPNANTKKCQWSVDWAKGTLRAQGRNAAGTMVCFDERKTADQPNKIVLTVEQPIVRPDNGETFKIIANGTDAAFILATIVDAQGNWCPLATNEITFSVSGQGTYVGSSNYLATPSQPLSYHAPGDSKLAAEGGMMKIAVRSTFTPGTITVNATAAGLTGATQVISTSNLTGIIKPSAPAAQPSIIGAGIKTFKTLGSSFSIPREFSGKAVSIKMYSLSGKLLRNEVVKAKRVGFTRYGIDAPGAYIVRCSEFRQAKE